MKLYDKETAPTRGIMELNEGGVGRESESHPTRLVVYLVAWLPVL